MPAVALTSEGAGQRPPVAGYANRMIMIDFPELSEEGDKVHVVIRNARTMTTEELTMPDACSALSEPPLSRSATAPSRRSAVAAFLPVTGF